MMSVASPQGDSMHPKLPQCVKEGCEETCFHKQGESAKGRIITHYYTCAECQAKLEYRNYGTLGVLVWVVDPYSNRLQSLSDSFFREVQKQIDEGVATLPSVPKGLYVHVHVQSAKGWRKL